MPYVLQLSGLFNDAERGLINKKWAVTDENGSPRLFSSKREALEYEGQMLMTSVYENKGFAYWNVYSSGQLSGSRGVPKWVHEDPERRPYWAR